jgi:class 3 adenylate cyclase/tetratricopeptide (TPR) repeat protein
VVLHVADGRLGGRRVTGLPSGTVTFLFTDIEGSTRLVKALRERYGQVLAEHRRLIRAAIADQAGYEVDTQGDAFFAVFGSAKQAVLCALEIQLGLAGHQWPADTQVRVRIGIHTGQAIPAEGNYTGLAVHRAARICAAAVGGQVLVSQATQMIIEDEEEEEPGFTLMDLGERQLKDLDRPVRLFQLAAPGLEAGDWPAVGRPSGGVAAATRGLPRDIASFTGRQHELAELMDAVVGAAESAGVVGIHAIGGMAGVGKTAFAVHAAHRLAGQFPAGQIFLPLHGHTPGQRPVDPADALASLLLTTGVDAAQIPPGLEARMALWRDRLAGRQLLLILDDAASSEQVFPLLPGAGGSLVLVTSRRHLSALDDATAISLDTLPPGEAAGLLVRLTGRPGLGPADPAVAEITRLCGFLPLAIGMVARQLHHHPAWTVAGRVAELAAAVDRSELIATENLSVAAAFNLSYTNLTEGQQRLFRRLGLHPGTEIDSYAAAALDGTGLAAASRGLEALYDQYLLSESAPGRYRMHDLIREHARALAERDDPVGDRDQAIGRLLDYYQHTAAQADALLALQASTPTQAPGTAPAAVPTMADREEALAWARAERANLLACLDHATGTGEHVRIIALTASLAALLREDGPWAEAITRHATALRSARHLGDRRGQADAISSLVDVRRLVTGDYPGAVRDLQEALAIYRDLGDQPGQANALANLGIVRQQTGDYPGAVRDLQEALAIYRDLGDRRGQAYALTNLVIVPRPAGEYPDAVQDVEEALGICRDLGDRRGQADALNALGNLRQLTEDYPGAARDLEEALGLYRDLGHRRGQANALTNLGRVRQLTGNYPEAAGALEEALGLYRDLGHRLGQANALTNLGRVRQAAGDYPGAAGALEEALAICRDLGDRGSQAYALTSLGRVRWMTGDDQGAARDLKEALRIWRDLGDRGGAAEVLNDIGALYRTRGDLRRAGSCHRQALGLARQIGSAWDEAHALAGLGRCELAADHTAKARLMLRQALEIFQRTGAAEAAEVSAELDALPGALPDAKDHDSGAGPGSAREEQPGEHLAGGQ